MASTYLGSLLPKPTNLANVYLLSSELVTGTAVFPSLAFNLLSGNDEVTTSFTGTGRAYIGLKVPINGSFVGAAGLDVTMITITGDKTTTGSVGLLNNGSYHGDLATGVTGSDDRLVISVLSNGAIGVQNTGSINFSGGADVVNGTVGNMPADISITDGFASTANIGLDNKPGSRLLTGAGDDRVKFDVVGAESTTILNGGAIDLGSGADRLDASVDNRFSSEIKGIGSTAIINSGVIATGLGADKVVSASIAAGGNAIVNSGTIDTTNAVDIVGASPLILALRDDNARDLVAGDVTSGEGAVVVEDYIERNGGGSAIINDGTIRTGGGIDVVDAICGGFGGTGTVDLGAGGDSLLGFGSGRFYGGTGIDDLTLPEGEYTISYIRVPSVATGTASAFISRKGSDAIMEIYDFEGIGGSALGAGLHFIDELNPLMRLKSFVLQRDANGAGELVGTPVYA